MVDCMSFFRSSSGVTDPGRAVRCPPSRLRLPVLRVCAILVLGLLSIPAFGDYPRRVRLQLKWHHQFQFAGYYAAQARGFYEEEGLDVEIIEGGVDRPPIRMVMEQKAEYGVGDSDIVLARMQGRPLVVIAAIFQHSPYVVLTRADSHIRTPADLVGRTIMLSDDQGAAQLRAMLLREGIDPSLVNVSPQSWNLDDLIEGRVDAVSAYATVEPFRLEQMGVEPAVIRASDYGVDFYGDTLFTTEHEVAAHADRVDAFRRASLKGWEYAMGHPEEIVDLILGMKSDRAGALTREGLLAEAEAMRPLILSDIVEIGHINTGRFRVIADTFIQVGLASTDVSVDELVFTPEEARTSELIRRSIWAAAILIAIASLIALWNVQMHRTVRRRTTALREEIATRKVIETDLRHSEERFRQLAENIRDAFWIQDLTSGRYLYVSPAYAEIWQRDPNELMNQPETWAASVFPEDLPAVSAALREQREGGMNIVHRVTRPDGSIRWIHARSFPIEDDSGEPTRVVGIAKDITDRKRLEDQVFRSQRMESIGTLAGGIAHDLNNVLAPIMLMADMLWRKENDPTRSKALETIKLSARRGADLIGQVLAFARGVEGERVEVHLEELIRQVRRIVDDTFLKTIHVQVEISDDLHGVLGDPTTLHQVLLNLCVNARDAMPEGGTLRITAENRTVTGPSRDFLGKVSPGEYVVVSVQDEGVGIATENLTRIFEPFFSTKPIGKGTGLGLSTSLAIVKSHNGFIDVQSTPGRGSLFEVYLPAAESSGELDAARDEDVALPRGTGETVLIVDDERTVRETAQQLLEELGYEVICASTGQEALETLGERTDVRLLLTDLMMPGMDGRELVAKVAEAFPTLPIVVSSGLLTEERIASIQPLIRGTLTKPYDERSLARAVRRALQ